MSDTKDEQKGCPCGYELAGGVHNPDPGRAGHAAGCAVAQHELEAMRRRADLAREGAGVSDWPRQLGLIRQACAGPHRAREEAFRDAVVTGKGAVRVDGTGGAERFAEEVLAQQAREAKRQVVNAAGGVARQVEDAQRLGMKVPEDGINRVERGDAVDAARYAMRNAAPSEERTFTRAEVLAVLGAEEARIGEARIPEEHAQRHMLKVLHRIFERME